MEMTMDSLPKLKSFFGIELELGVQIFSLVLAVNVFVLHPKDLCGTYYCLGGLLGGLLLQNLLGVPAGIRMVLTALLMFLASPTSGLLWITVESTLATLSVGAFGLAYGLAFFALQWNRTRKFLIPAAIMSPIWSLVSLIIFFDMMKTSAGAIDIALILFEAIISAYYWVGLMTVFGLKNPVANPAVV